MTDFNLFYRPFDGVSQRSTARPHPVREGEIGVIGPLRPTTHTTAERAAAIASVRAPDE